MNSLVLELFPGISLFGRAFEEAGFCVVRGPDVLWGGDIRAFRPHAGRFDGIIGGPPCQRFSRLANLVEHRYGPDSLADNLIPEFERVVSEAQPSWFVMENVPDAPVPVVPGYGVTPVILNNRWFGEEQNRIRRFSFGLADGRTFNPWRLIQIKALEPASFEYAVLGKWGGLKKSGRGYDKTERQIVRGYNAAHRPIWRCAELQGMPRDFLEDAPFTQTAKRQLIANGVPMALGRAVAHVVLALTAQEPEEAAS